MLDGLFVPVLRDIDYLAPAAPYPVVPSGITVHEKPIYRYSVDTDEYPTIAILDYIPDHNGNFIKPGYYQLALSDDKTFLYLIESKNLIAIIPVFKIAENKKEVKKLQTKDKELTKEEKKEKRKLSREQKIKEIIDTKYAKTGATPPKEYEHMEAKIEYIKEKGYYLFTYEKGFIRAWGAVKI